MKTGQKAMTRGIAAKMAENEQFAKQVTHFFGRYLEKDWGEISETDKKINDWNIENGSGSLMGVYETCEGRIWIMTDEYRYVTTILFPEEY